MFHSNANLKIPSPFSSHPLSSHRTTHTPYQIVSNLHTIYPIHPYLVRCSLRRNPLFSCKNKLSDNLKRTKIHQIISSHLSQTHENQAFYRSQSNILPKYQNNVSIIQIQHPKFTHH